ncbi:MAG: membrane integrity-associated transporter subunit PqiC [Desulfovibrionaceae bacterium]|nr:membrane integrity-associated transporter subunit PqiC [Desulfovibrionaceae bacterium]
MKRHILTLLVLTAILAVGCVKLTHDPIHKRYFQIVPERTEKKAATSKGVILKVRRLSVSAPYETRELIYRECRNRIESDYYNTFFATPGAMLTTGLRKWLRESNLFTHIIEPGSMVVPGLTLEGMVNALYGDYSGDAPFAVVEMQFFVVDENTAMNDVVFSGDYAQRIPMTEPDPAALVQAMTEGVQTIFADLESDLSKADLE